MHTIFAKEDIQKKGDRTIFLAGPTPRQIVKRQWRQEAFSYLQSQNFDGTVISPINQDFSPITDEQYTAGHIEWEYHAMSQSDVIVFWVPRDLKIYPAFTTNIEWGMWLSSGKVVLGYPKDTPGMTHMTHYAKKLYIPLAYTLEKTLDNACQMARGTSTIIDKQAILV